MIWRGWSVARSFQLSPNSELPMSCYFLSTKSNSGQTSSLPQTILYDTIPHNSINPSITIFLSPFSLMERMLEWAVTDNREASAATLPQHTENAVRLLHIVQDFLQAEGLVNPALWTDKVLEETVTLMDSLMVWYSAGNQWFHLCQVGLRLLLGFMAQEDPDVRWCFYCLPVRFDWIAASFCKTQTDAITLITDLSLRSVLWPLPSSMVSCRLRRCLVRMKPATY